MMDGYDIHTLDHLALQIPVALFHDAHLLDADVLGAVQCRLVPRELGMGSQ